VAAPAYLLAVGSVTSDQYMHARKEVWEKGAKPKLCRISEEEWGLLGVTPVAILQLDYKRMPHEGRRWLKEAWVPILSGSRFHVPAQLLLEEIPGREVRMIRSALEHELRAPVRAVVVDETAWYSQESQWWQQALPDAAWYCAHSSGWVETL